MTALKITARYACYARYVLASLAAVGFRIALN
jgi:hypothetical protein